MATVKLPIFNVFIIKIKIFLFLVIHDPRNGFEDKRSLPVIRKPLDPIKVVRLFAISVILLCYH